MCVFVCVCHFLIDCVCGAVRRFGEVLRCVHLHTHTQCLIHTPTHLDRRGVKHVEAPVLIGVVDELIEVLVPGVGVLEMEVAVMWGSDIGAFAGARPMSQAMHGFALFNTWIEPPPTP